MKHRYVRYFLFFATVIVADTVIGYGISSLSKKQVYDNRIGLLLQDKINADIIILGSSQALNDYSPEIISKYTGLSCYNMGVSGSDPVFHETLLDLLLLNPKKPRLIIYNIGDPAALYTMKGIIYRSDFLSPYVNYPYINDQVCKHLKRSRMASLLSKSYQQNVNFANALKYLLRGKEKVDFKVNNIGPTGAVLIDSNAQAPAITYLKREMQKDEPEINESYSQALLAIQNKCLKNGIKLLFCFPPQYADPTDGFSERIRSLTQPEVLTVSFSESLKEPQCYYDRRHLNCRGALRFSALLAEQLKGMRF